MDKLDEIAERLWMDIQTAEGEAADQEFEEHPPFEVRPEGMEGLDARIKRLSLPVIRAALDEARQAALDEWRRPTQADEKYGRDHGQRISLGELVTKIMTERDPEKFLDVLDSEFLIGCWGHALKSGRDPNLLRDLRGFIVEALKYARREDRAEMKAEHAKLLACERHVAGLETELQEAHGLKQMARDEAIKLHRDLDAKDHQHAEDRAEIERLRAEVKRLAREFGETAAALMERGERLEAAEAKLAEAQAMKAEYRALAEDQNFKKERAEQSLAAERAKTAKLVEALTRITTEVQHRRDEMQRRCAAEKPHDHGVLRCLHSIVELLDSAQAEALAAAKASE